MALALALAGCVSAPKPRDTARLYLQALEQGRQEEAYRLTSNSFRQRVSPEDFARLAQRGGVQDLAASPLREGEEGITAMVTTEGGASLALVWEKGRWRVAQGLVPLVDQSTPEAALRMFKEALLCRRWDLVYQLVPAELRQGLTEEALARALAQGDRADRMVRQLEELKGVPLRVEGHVALVRAGRREVVLKRVGESWYIFDPI